MHQSRQNIEFKNFNPELVDQEKLQDVMDDVDLIGGWLDFKADMAVQQGIETGNLPAGASADVLLKRIQFRTQARSGLLSDVPWLSLNSNNRISTDPEADIGVVVDAIMTVATDPQFPKSFAQYASENVANIVKAQIVRAQLATSSSNSGDMQCATLTFVLTEQVPHGAIETALAWSQLHVHYEGIGPSRYKLNVEGATRTFALNRDRFESTAKPAMRGDLTRNVITQPPTDIPI